MSANEILRSQIRALAGDAAEAGDLEMVDICRRALRGDDKARAECARVVWEAKAMEDGQ